MEPPAPLIYFHMTHLYTIRRRLWKNKTVSTSTLGCEGYVFNLFLGYLATVANEITGKKHV